MQKGTTTKGNQFLILSLLTLNFPRTTLLTDAESIICNFSVKHRITTGECLVNGQTLLQLDNKSQDTLLHKLVKEDNAIKACADLLPKMKGILEEITNQESGSSKTTGDHTINVTMESRYNQGQVIDPRWTFTMDGQHPFYFYPSNKTWRWSHPDASSTMKQWEANRDLTLGLSTLSEGDFRKCLRMLSTHLTEKPRPTIKTLDTTQLTSAIQSLPTVNSTQLASTTESPSIVNSTQLASTTKSTPGGKSTHHQWSKLKIFLPPGVAVVLGLMIISVCCVFKYGRNKLGSCSCSWEALSDFHFQCVEGWGRRIARRVEACCGSCPKLKASLEDKENACLQNIKELGVAENLEGNEREEDSAV